MKKLYLTNIFHWNLYYSGVKRKDIPEVLNKCYWPLINIISKNPKMKIGIEMPIHTLELIKKFDDSLFLALFDLQDQKRIEIIGSGLIQDIFPLCPKKVNEWNIQLGKEGYLKYFNKIPKIWYLNEQCYSDDLIKLYAQNDIHQICFDYCNTQDMEETKYSVCNILSWNHEYRVNVLWNNSMAFQMFQKYIFGKISKNNYMNYVLSNHSDKEDRVFMLYGSDGEIFNYRPLGYGELIHDEWKRIESLWWELDAYPHIQFILPSEAKNKNYKESWRYKLESENPILTKKQLKYNANRWAVCGNCNFVLNTACFAKYEKVKNQKKPNRELVLAFASDLRTNATKEKLKEVKEWLK